VHNRQDNLVQNRRHCLHCSRRCNHLVNRPYSRSAVRANNR
jgi:hypothetical protein